MRGSQELKKIEEKNLDKNGNDLKAYLIKFKTDFSDKAVVYDPEEVTQKTAIKLDVFNLTDFINPKIEEEIKILIDTADKIHNLSKNLQKIIDDDFYDKKIIDKLTPITKTLKKFSDWLTNSKKNFDSGFQYQNIQFILVVFMGFVVASTTICTIGFLCSWTAFTYYPVKLKKAFTFM